MKKLLKIITPGFRPGQEVILLNYFAFFSSITLTLKENFTPLPSLASTVIFAVPTALAASVPLAFTPTIFLSLVVNRSFVLYR